LSTRRVYKKRKLFAFTLIEVMVALSVIGVATFSTVAIFSNSMRYMAYDYNMQKAVETADKYFANLYLAGDIRKELFSQSELTNILNARAFPLLLRPERHNISDNIYMLINKNIIAWNPLTVDIGLEIIIEPEGTNRTPRHLWFETTFCENYLKKLE